MQDSTHRTGPSRSDSETAERLRQHITPTIEMVADWHLIDSTLDRDWERPLVRLLRFFVGDDSHETERQIENDVRAGSAEDTVDEDATALIDITSIVSDPSRSTSVTAVA